MPITRIAVYSQTSKYTTVITKTYNMDPIMSHFKPYEPHQSSSQSDSITSILILSVNLCPIHTSDHLPYRIFTQNCTHTQCEVL